MLDFLWRNCNSIISKKQHAKEVKERLIRTINMNLERESDRIPTAEFPITAFIDINLAETPDVENVLREYQKQGWTLSLEASKVDKRTFILNLW